jgi:ABC-type multidrug transport system ATPase subunit
VTETAVAGGAAIRTRGLTKRFGAHVAVGAVDLDVPRGAVYGFLGPNGSGKTTTIRMLLGLVRPTAGEVELLGAPVPDRAGEVLPRVGALVEGPGFHPHLTGAANLRRLDAVDAAADHTTGRQRVAAALERVGLTAAAGKRYRQYSLGMKQRLAIAAALLGPREVLVLDEPTNGLDPQGTREIRALIGHLAADGVTVLVSSHLLAEVEQVCTHLGIMNAGRLVAQGAVDDLRGGQRAGVSVTTSDPAAAAAVLTRLGLTEVGTSASGAHGTPDPEHEPSALVVALVAAGVPVSGFAVTRPSLEELFVELTGEGYAVDA